LTIDSLMYW